MGAAVTGPLIGCRTVGGRATGDLQALPAVDVDQPVVRPDGGGHPLLVGSGVAVPGVHGRAVGGARVPDVRALGAVAVQEVVVCGAQRGGQDGPAVSEGDLADVEALLPVVVPV